MVLVNANNEAGIERGVHKKIVFSDLPSSALKKKAGDKGSRHKSFHGGSLWGGENGLGRLNWDQVGTKGPDL